MTNKPKKQGWEYALEAKRAKKAALDAAATTTLPASPPPLPKVPSPKVKVSTPESDFGHKTITVNFQRRAGLTSYGQELVERLNDLNDDAASAVYYLLPVKLPKKVYKRLLEGAIELSKASPNWTERDQLEALVIFQDAKNLLSPKE